MRWTALALPLLLMGCPKTTGVEAPQETTVPEPSPFPTLQEGQVVQGFRAQAVYLDDAGSRFGARLVHEHSGFVLDYVQIPSVNQGFLWVNSVPISERGEPHTQEHLLLGKGNKGRTVGSQSAMSLVESSAYTEQVRTIYHFHTPASTEVFLDTVHFQLDGLLHPDYSDEEIRREVHHYGVSTGPDGELYLEEKGTIYNEMASSSDKSWARFWRTLGKTLYGDDHPYAVNAGGWPAAVREMKPEHIRGFHAANYQLGNMGMIVAIAPNTSVQQVLAGLDARLRLLQPDATPADADFVTEEDLPPPAPAPAGSVHFAPYPSSDGARPGEVAFAWGPSLELDLGEEILLDAFLSAFAGSSASPLYKRLIDSSTRQVQLGGTGVYAFAWDQRGLPIIAGIEGLPADHLTAEDAEVLKTHVTGLLKEIAAYPADSPELAQLDRLVASTLAVDRRGLKKVVGSPPRWGYRGTGSTWNDLLMRLDREGGFEREVTMGTAYAKAEAALTSGSNPWSERLGAWGLLDTPFTIINLADPELLAAQQAERTERLAAEVARLREGSGAATDQEALAGFQRNYDGDTAALKAAEAATPMPKLVDGPPLTFDRSLDYAVDTVPGTQIPRFQGFFSTMPGASVSLSLDLKGLDKHLWVALSALATLMHGSGVVIDGKVLPHTLVTERLQQEILGLHFYIDGDLDSGRHRLIVTGSGTSGAEADRAIYWMTHLLADADLGQDNLSRLRDEVSELLVANRRVMQGSEESWVMDPAAAWRSQTDGALLSTQSVFTRTHNLQRLKWQLAPMPGPAFGAFLDTLGATAPANIAFRLDEISAGTAPEVKPLSAQDAALAKSLAEDLKQIHAQLPPESVAADWRYLVGQARADLSRDPILALGDLHELRTHLLSKARASALLVGSRESLAALDLGPLVQRLVEAPAPQALPPAGPWLTRRLNDRGIDGDPRHVGLYAPDMNGGVLILTADGPSLAKTDRDTLLDTLAGNTYTGHGAHSLFMKTWSAGLAYSNGVRPNLVEGRMLYYAERTPELPQTLAFVIEQLKAAEVDEGIAQYAIAGAFDSREGASFEGRTAAMQVDLLEGRTPEMVAGFRTALLDLRDEAALPSLLQSRLESVYSPVMPGWGTDAAEASNGQFFVIGDDRQLSAWQTYLERNDSSAGALVRIYPRDFWITE